MDIIQLNLFDWALCATKAKTCSRCRVIYEDAHANFHKCSTTHDGFQCRCKSCRRKEALKRWEKQEVRAKAKTRQEQNKEKKAAYDKEYRQRNAELRHQQSKEYVKKNRERINAWNREYTSKNRERRREIANNYVERNREKVREANRLYSSKNPEKRIARRVIRRCREAQCCPSWVNVKSIREFHKLARLMTEATGEPYHVDHIDPIAHSLVCGLHVPANLRVIKGCENFAKSNKFKPYGFDGHYYLV